VNTSCFPRAGTVVLEALYRSRPSALGDPRVGDRACSDSLTKRSRDEEEKEEAEEEDVSIM
jgi:hypothetical protein